MMPVNFTPIGQRDGKTRGDVMATKQGSPTSERSEHGSNAYHSMAASITSPQYSYYDSDNTHEYSSLFSPEYKAQAGGQDTRTRNSVNANKVADLGDPFTQSRPVLNAAASAFQPSTVKSSAASSTKYTSKVPITTEEFVLQRFQSEFEQNQRVTRSGQFTIESVSRRTIKVEVRAQGDPVQAIMNYLHLVDGPLYGAQRYLTINNVVYILNTDITDAVAIYKVLSKAHALGNVFYSGSKILGNLFPHLAGQFTDYEGQIVVSAPYPAGATTSSTKADFEADVLRVVSQMGSIYAFKTLPARDDDVFTVQIELHNIENVPRVVLRLNGNMIQGRQLCIEARHPDTEKDPYNYVAAANLPSEMAKALDKISLGDSAAAFAGIAASATFGSAASMATHTSSNAYPSGPQSQAMPYVNTQGMYGVVPQAMPMAYTPAGMAMVPYNGQVMMMTPLHPSQFGMSLQGGYSNDLGEYGSPSSYNSYGHGRGRDSYRGSFGYRGGRGNNQRSLMGPSDWHDSKKPENVVNIERIMTGLDVRTTVMLRNIPNKMTQWELMQILNKIIFGKYDFVYLRIDFSNGCNVGYAFLNFLDPLDIIPFVKAIANRRWEDFKSDKIAEVSYATIQGRDCLIQKFRNSSVMLEEEECRPKLYYTEGHPYCGQEEPFPPSDNQSKLKRSCENAEHIGLFAPAHGQHYRQEQRNRNSQWDRGTTLADRERGHRLGFGSSNRGDFDDNFRSNFNGGSHRGTFNSSHNNFDLVRSTAFRNEYNGERGSHEGARGGHNGDRGGFEGGRNAAHRGGFGNGSRGAFNGGNNSFDNGPPGGFIEGNSGFSNGPQGGANGDFEDGSQGGSNGGAGGAHGLAFAPHVRRPQDPRHGDLYRQY